MNGDRGFKYVDMHKEFMLRNNKVIILSESLSATHLLHWP